MTLTVFDNLLNLEREVGRIFGGLDSPSYPPLERRFPSLDVADYGNETVLTADMPGVRREDLKIRSDNNVLTLSGNRPKQTLPEGGSWIRNETWDGAFSRSIQLPRLVKADSITAELNNGVLRIVVPKAEEAKARQIEVKVN